MDKAHRDLRKLNWMIYTVAIVLGVSISILITTML